MKGPYKLSFGLTFVLIMMVLTGCQPPDGEVSPTSPGDTHLSADPTIEEEPILFELTTDVDPQEAGYVYPGEGKYQEGTDLQFRVKPADGYEFDHWSGDFSGEAAELSTVIDGDMAVTAHFHRISYLQEFTLDEKVYSSNHVANIAMDFDLDGDLDLILGQFDWPPPQDPQAVLAYRNDGNGNFEKATAEVFADIPVVTFNITDWAIADFNGDGLEDLFLGDGGQDHDPFLGGQSLILIQNGEGQLIDETQSRLPELLAFTHNVAAGDIDGDGDVDIYLCNIWNSTQVGPRFLINDGEGYFSADSTRIPGEITSLSRKFTASVLVDVDLDDDLDLVLGGHDRPGTRDVILLNDGFGKFTYAPDDSMPPRLGGPGFDTVLITPGDINQDGWPDLLMSTHLKYQFDPNVQLLINNGDGTFRDETARIEQDWSFHRNQNGCGGSTDGWVTGISIVDANNDSWPDILVSGDSCLDYILFLSEEGERFVAAENYGQLRNKRGDRHWGLIPGDVDNDGNLDIVLIYGDMNCQVYIRVPGEELDQVVATPASGDPEEAIVIPANLEESFRDDFDNELKAGWEWISDDQPHWSLTDKPGYLQFTLWTSYATDRLLRPAPEGDFEIVAKIRINPVSNFQQAGLTIYQDQDNVISLVKAFCFLPDKRGLCVGQGIYFDKSYYGATGWSNFPTEIDFTGEVYLKIIRVGDAYTAYYGPDGEDWIEIGTHVANFQSPMIGITAGVSTYAFPASVDFFQIKE